MPELFGQNFPRRSQLFLFDEDGKMYPAILVVFGDEAEAYAPGFDAIHIFDISSLTITQARKMGYKVIYANRR